MIAAPFTTHMRLSLRKNFVWMVLGTGVENLSKWGMLAVLAKLTSVEIVGVFGLALALTAPVVMFFNLGLRQAQATDVRREYLFEDYFRLRSVTNVLACSLIVLLGVVLGYAAEQIAVVALVGLFGVVSAQSDAYYGLFQLHERMDFIARSRIVRGPLALLFLALGVLHTGDLVVGAIGMVAAALLVLLLVDRHNARRFLTGDRGMASQAHGDNPARDNRHLSVLSIESIRRTVQLALLVLPLGVVGFFMSLQTSIPRLLVEANLGFALLGYFVAIVAAYSASSMMVNSLAHAASPRLARAFASGNKRAFVKLLAKMSLVGIGLGGSGICIAYFFGEVILSFLYTGDYGAYSDVFVLVMIAALFRFLANLWQMGISAARQFRVQFILHFGVVMVVLVSCMILIPTHGLVGAAVAMILAAIAHMVGVLLIIVWLVRRLDAPVTAKLYG